jgi:manganese efflux pump family protein
VLSGTGIAFALAADCFAVSVSSGTRTENLAETALKFALYFGTAQAVMLSAGWFAGAWFRRVMYLPANIAAFSFLAVAGIRMISEGLGNGKERNLNLDSPNVILGLAIATSIDALIVGTGLSILRMPLFSTALTVGAVAFVISYAGVYAGRRAKKKLSKNAEIAGGIILLFIGARILISGII